MKRKEKGSFGYIRSQQIYTSIRTVILFALSLGLYAAGYMTTHTNKNLLTIVAVLSLLPAAKSMVNMIMFLRFKSLSKEQQERLEISSEVPAVLYEMILTTTEQAYFLPMMAYRNRTLIAFCEKAGDLKSLETHIKESVKNGGVDISVKIFPDERIFSDRLSAMKDHFAPSAKEQETETVFQVLKAISL